MITTRKSTAPAFRFTDEEMEIAKETDLPDLLEHLGYQLKRVGNYYTTREMDSIRVKDNSFNFLVSLLYSQAFQALYYSADQIHHGALPCHVHFVLDEFAAMSLPGFTRELATMRSRNISASTIIQNMAQIKELRR